MSLNNIELIKKINDVVRLLIEEKGYICSVDLLKKLEYLSEKDYENWRFGRVTCLENVCAVNLSKLSLINKTIKKIATEMKLKPSITVYNKYGKGPKQKLIFSKSRIKSIEDAYATHYVNLYKTTVVEHIIQ